MGTLQISIAVLALLVAMALLFDFLNGFHDAANAIATVVSTGVLRPSSAVLMAAGFNLLAFFIFQTRVAELIVNEMVNPAVVDQYIIFAALGAAVLWSLLTWALALPSSSSHALIGGLIGAAFAKAGTAALMGHGLWLTLAFLLLSPLLGFLFGSLMMLLVSWLFVGTTPKKIDKWFRRLQLGSAALYSLGHGGNDAQKTMGIIWMLLIATGYAHAADRSPPVWVALACYGAISLGTLFGGWRIVKTVGQRITRLKPVGGFCAEAGGAITVFCATTFGVPVSTTHTITGAIVGVGAVQRMSAVRWGTAGNILASWALTMPAAALISALLWWLAQRLF